MLGKLLKNELKSYRFSFGIIFLAAFVFTIFMKIICMIPYPYEAREFIQMMGFYGYYYLIMLVSAAAQVLVIINFYTTMTGDRGYLTWTLPATSATHISVKLIGGMLWRLLAGVVTVILLLVFVTGKYWTFFEEFKQQIPISLLWEQFLEIWKLEYFIPIILGILNIIIWSIVTTLFIYMCIAIGQLFGKWRLLASIGCYFLSIILLQVVFFIIILVISIGDVFSIFENFNMSVLAEISLTLTVVLLLGAGIGAGLFAITNHIFKNNLNLE